VVLIEKKKDCNNLQEEFEDTKGVIRIRIHTTKLKIE